jgi:MFS family permease
MIEPYRALVRRPGVARVVLAGIIGRAPIGIVSIAIVLLVHSASGSFAAAGVVDAAFAIASAVGSPLQGRWVDMAGQTRVLALTAAVHGISLGALVAVALGHGPTGTMALCAVAAGATVPPLSASLRALWPSLARDEAELSTAFALESVSVEMFFILGPAACGALVAVSSPAAATLAAVGLTLAGTALFATSEPSRRWRAAPLDRPPAGSLASPGMRALTAAIVPEGVAFGVLGIAVPAFAVRHGHPAAAGWLLAAQALGSAAGGLWYGARVHRSPLGTRFTVLFALFALGLAPLALAGSLPVLALILLVGGVVLAPLAATGFELVERLAPPGTSAESYNWTITALVAGTALGAALGGAVVQGPGERWGLLVAAGVAALGPLVALLGRRALAG